MISYQSGSIKFYEKFIFFSVHFLHLPNFVTTTGHNFNKIGESYLNVSVLSLTVFCIYTRLQVYVSVPSGVGIYIHMGVQVDTDNLTTYHFLEQL